MVCGNHELADDGWFLQVCQGKAVLCAIGIQGSRHGCAWRPGHDGKRSFRSGPLQATPTVGETSDKRTNTHPGFGKHAGSSCVLGLVGETDGAGVGGCRKERTAGRDAATKVGKRTGGPIRRCERRTTTTTIVAELLCTFCNSASSRLTKYRYWTTGIRGAQMGC